LYDLENDIVADAKIAPISGNERSLAEEHLRALEKMDCYKNGHLELLIFDRGYPSHELIKSLTDKEIGYVMRVQKGFIREAELAGKKDGWVRVGKAGHRVRVIQIPLSTGETETLITNLAKTEIEYGALGELYHKRWGIETKYKELKQKLERENFCGRLVENVKQDF
jgi:IS4 transposase